MKPPTYEELLAAGQPRTSSIQPVSTADRSKNTLRPQTWDDIVGQARAKALLKRAVEHAFAGGDPLDHTLLVGPSGVGKSTISHVLASELRVDVFEIEAPVSFDTLLELREVMTYGDILRIEEIHQQGIMERRGRQTATQPEVLYAVMEDRVIQTQAGTIPFPPITIIGTTTDEGLLPDPFINRFPLRPRLEPYTLHALKQIAEYNAAKLGVLLTDQAAMMFARASRGVPRQINNYMRNAAMWTTQAYIDSDVAREVLVDLNGVTEDGLTPDQQAMLTFLYTRGRHVRATDGAVKYQASLSTIATAIGKSRDSKAIQLRVEPYLIECGFVQVGGGGRVLTEDGIVRAQQLVNGP